MALTKEDIQKKVNEMESREKRRKQSGNIAKSSSTVPHIDPKALNTAIADAALDNLGYPNRTGETPNPQVTALGQQIFSRMSCPLLSIERWNCNQAEPGKSVSHTHYRKGEETQCSNGNFCNCSAYRLYFNFRIAQRAKQRGKKKEAKKKDR